MADEKSGDSGKDDDKNRDKDNEKNDHKNRDKDNETNRGNDDGKRRNRDDDKGKNKQDKDEKDGPIGGRDLAWRAYLKLAATLLLTLIVFAALLRGCASIQGSNPITGEPTQQAAPPPPGG